ncbi:MAG TPA: hypothetical protein VMV83_16860 [Rectinemataceae bacterium]|nr:hypothetical protein [Rectinemataceae bacterium]
MESDPAKVSIPIQRDLFDDLPLDPSTPRPLDPSTPRPLAFDRVQGDGEAGGVRW